MSNIDREFLTIFCLIIVVLNIILVLTLKGYTFSNEVLLEKGIIEYNIKHMEDRKEPKFIFTHEN